MQKIIISPYSKPLLNGKTNAKNFPSWQELVALLIQKGYEVIQVGSPGEEIISGTSSVVLGAPLSSLQELVKEALTWISVDNFFPHFATIVCHKPGIVLWGKSDPSIFGYPSNFNLLKSKDNLRKEQFKYWEDEEYDPSVFVSSESVVKVLEENFSHAHTE